MLPILIGGATLAMIYKAKPACSICGSKFTWNRGCAIDDLPVCGDCGLDLVAVEYKGKVLMPAMRCCKAHADQYLEKVAQEKAKFDRMMKAMADAENVTVYSRNFKGEVPPPKLGKRIETESYKEKDEAEFQLKVLAALDECTSISQVEFKKDTEEDGNYKYSVWRCSGLI